MINGQAKNMMIGVFIIAACTLLVGIVMFLKPTVGDGQKILYVRFSNINKISVGTRVTYAGKPVGEVIAVDYIYEPRKQPVDTLGRYYFYQLVLKVDSSVVVYNTDEISLQTSGLLGEKSVAIIPKKPPKGITPKLISNQPLYASSVEPFEQTFVELSELANKMDETVDLVTNWIKDHGENLGCAVKTFGGAMHQIDVAVATVNQELLVQEVNTTVKNVNGAICQIKDALTKLENEKFYENVGATARNVKKATRSFELVSQDLVEGKGTLGRLIKDDDLYLRFSAVMSKVSTLMNDINQYGMLFHLNKSWQRTHTARMNLMNTLDTPDDFKSYFETEVAQVNSSMARLSMLISRAEKSPEREEILQDELFKKDFAELLRKADTLSENLRLYNQQLMEAMNP